MDSEKGTFTSELSNMPGTHQKWGCAETGAHPHYGWQALDVCPIHLVPGVPAEKWTRRLACQHTSVDSVHCGFSFP